MKGKTDKEICRELGLSITTVRTHWTRLRKKLGVVNRAQAIAECMELESNEQLKLMQARVKAMHRALNQRGLAVWEWHPDSDCVFADELSARIFGRGVETGPVPLGEFLTCLSPEDRNSLTSLLREPKLTSAADGVAHRVAIRGARQLQVRTRATRVVSDGRTMVFCTSETVGQL